MKRKPRHYQRTAALLGAQPHVTQARAVKPLTLPRISWQVALPLVLIGALVLWLVLDARWYVSEENVQVMGTTSQLLATEVARASDLLDWHSLLLRPQAAEDLILAAVPGVVAAAATCHRFPVDCVIKIEERSPHLVWQTESATYWADQHGTLFAAQDERDDLPRVSAALPDKKATVLPEDIMLGVDALTALELPEEIVLLSFDYHPRRGLIWIDAEGRRIAFGTGPGMVARWQMYEALILYLDAKGVFPASVDVRFPSGPTYSLERTW